MTVVILDFMTHNLMFQGRFNPKNPSPPVCFAIGKEINTMVPSDNSPDKQSDDCTSCPMNQFGSNGNGKACKNTRVLAVVAPNAEEGSPIMTLSVAPMGLKDYDKYVNDVARRFNLPPVGVLTEISFDENADFEKLLFKVVGPNENLKMHWGRKAEALEILSVEPNLTRIAAPASPPARHTPRPGPRRLPNGPKAVHHPDRRGQESAAKDLRAELKDAKARLVDVQAGIKSATKLAAALEKEDCSDGGQNRRDGVTTDPGQRPMVGRRLNWRSKEEL